MSFPSRVFCGALALGLWGGACGTTGATANRSAVVEESRAPEVRVVTQIYRSELAVALSEGPGRILQRVQLYPFRDGERFVGYQIVGLFAGENVEIIGVYVGDILLSVNGYVIDRPDKLMALWVDLAQATEVVVEVLREGQRTIARFPVVEDTKVEKSRPRMGSPDGPPVAP